MKILESDFMRIARMFEKDDVTIRLAFHKAIQEGKIFVHTKELIELI